jgi:hypothetical protein
MARHSTPWRSIYQRILTSQIAPAAMITTAVTAAITRSQRVGTVGA